MPPSGKCHEFAGRLGKIVTVCCREGKPVLYIKIANYAIS